MHLHDERLNGFMETKGDLRGLSLPVTRQIGAQMAAFIYDQDIKISKNKAGREFKTAHKGQGKQAKGKGSNILWVAGRFHGYLTYTLPNTLKILSEFRNASYIYIPGSSWQTRA